MSFQEIEFKHNASKVSLDAFNKLCEKIKDRESHRNNLGYDSFFTNVDKPDTFFRIREDEGKLELTFKRKLNSENVVRVEYNLLVNSKEQAVALIEEMGYKFDRTIGKVNHVHVYPWYVLSYYMCYDSDMSELGRFIEIEMREDVEASSDQAVIVELKIIENMLKPLGLSTETRVISSLYELYRSKS